MTSAVVGAFLVTLAGLLLLRLVAPSGPPAAAQLAALLEPRAGSRPTPRDAPGAAQVIGAQLRSRGLLPEVLERDLVAAEVSIERLVLRSAASLVSFASIGICLSATLAFTGLGQFTELLILGVFLISLGGLFVPGLLIRTEAGERREALRRELPGLLDLCCVHLASGESLEASIRRASVGHASWPYEQVRAALEAGALKRTPASECLRELGHKLAISELIELGEGLSVAQREGAAVRTSLSARARGLRDRQLSEAETQAGKATEGMSFPLVVFVLGFVLLIGFPALTGLGTGLGSP